MLGDRGDDLLAMRRDRQCRVEVELEGLGAQAFDVCARALDGFAHRRDGFMELLIDGPAREQPIELACKARSIGQPRVLKPLAQLQQRRIRTFWTRSN